MIQRTEHGFIKDNYSNDLMDCACRTGLMAICDITTDIALLNKFEIKNGILVRCPEQTWAERNPWNFTRDQLVPFISGCSQLNSKAIVKRVFYKHKERFFFCQNYERDFPGSGFKVPDICGPEVIWHMIKIGKIKEWYWFGIIGIPYLLLCFIYNAIFYKKEQNQILSIALSHGVLTTKIYLFFIGYDRLKQSLYDYWCGWRNQKEIADLLLLEVRIKSSQDWFYNQ